MNRLLVSWRTVGWQGARACWGLVWWMSVVSGAAWADDRPIDPSADSAMSELRVKAAYLYKFGAFVQWPDRAFASADAPVVIGVLDADSLADELSMLIGGRSVQGRSLAVRRLRSGDSLAGIHMLFMGHPTDGRTAVWLAAARGRPVLTVTDRAQPAVPGTMINFVHDGGRVRFDVFPKAAELASLGISARLLVVARRVEPGAP
jgi:hypothetical protein